MIDIARIVVVISAALLTWGYVGYPLAIAALATIAENLRKRPAPRGSPDIASVSVVIAAYNAEANIARRIRNILDLVLPHPLSLEILVGSDGSIDQTAALARAVESSKVRVFDFPRRGRAATHNDLVAAATGDVIVFTDADTEFDPTFLSQLLPEFGIPHVDGVVGRLVLRNSNRPIGLAERWYWAYDTWIRRSESQVGIMSFGSGACMAMRRTAVRPIDPLEDVDFASTMDAVFEGSVLRFATNAIAFDIAPDDPRAEYYSRARMTARNLRGVFRRMTPRNLINRPAVAFAIASRRLIRWLSAPLLVVVVIGAILSIPGFWLFEGSVLVLGLLLAATGWLYDRRGRAAPAAASLAYGFAVASVGMAVGVLWAVSGRVPRTYVQPSVRN